MIDQESATEVTNTIVEFISVGAQKYEQLHVLGLINPIDPQKQKIVEEPVEDYIQ